MPDADSITTNDRSVRQWVRPAIQGLQAYQVPSAQGMIKLDAMENPYLWPAELRADWATCLAEVNLNRYPDPQAQALKARLRSVLDIPAEHGLMLGNGSDELLQIVMLSMAKPGSKLLVPEPTFSMYRIIAELVGMEYVGVPLNADDFELNVDAMLAAIATHVPALLILCYPNNPTGNCFNPKEVARLIAAAPGLVLIDEAYFHFAQSSLLKLMTPYSHVVVLRTLSKLGLAGLRLGLLCGHPAWLDQFDKARLPYNINTLSQVSASYMLEHVDILDEQARHIRADRSTLITELAALGTNVKVWPSATNFVLLRIAGHGNAIYRGLIEHGILVKSLHGAHPLLSDCLRVTIGTPSENQAFVAALRQLLADAEQASGQCARVVE